MFAMGFLATPWPMGNIGFIETILSQQSNVMIINLSMMKRL